MLLHGYEYGVLEFSSKCRVLARGVKFTPCFAPATPKYIQCKKARKDFHADVWAKVRGDELVEILGPVGDGDVEATVIALAHNIIPCKFPAVSLQPCELPAEVVHGAITIDGPLTQDMDDAVSFHDDFMTIAIHVTDTTRLHHDLLPWALQRGASAYWFNGRVTPMVPPALANHELSLREGCVRPCISLFLRLSPDGTLVEGASHRFTAVTVAQNVTYAAFAAEERFSGPRGILGKISKTDEAEQQVAWLMTQYNEYFARLLSSAPPALMRVQTDVGQPAFYAQGGTTGQTHAAFDHRAYGHFTSPIRRYADMHNQLVLKGLVDAPLGASELEALNDRMREVGRFHALSAVAGLAYRYMEKPTVLDAEVEATDDGSAIVVHLPDKRVRIPLKDNYFAEPICERLCQEGATKVRVEMFGVLQAGRARLRMRLADAPMDGHDVTFARTRDNMMANQVANGVPTPTQQFSDANVNPNPTLNPNDTSKEVARIEEVVGYALDTFQCASTAVIASGDDLLGLAPTGSGKTVLALTGIVLMAFDKGRRAVLTSPIKALSNQKYSEFCAALNGRVSLLTGDVQIRAAPPGGDGEPELIIMTSEILANKLAVSRASGHLDADLRDVSIVVMDEVHYINDPERGHVWETSIMMMPTDVQIVALSATLDQPHKFCEWMCKRRPTRMVQRHDRHVPLYFGGFDARGAFVELFNTHARERTFNTSSFDAVFRSKERHTMTLKQSVDRLVKLLESSDQLPAIVFCMSRDRCVGAASCVTRDLMLGFKVEKQKDQDEYEFMWLDEEQRAKVQAVRKRQDEMYRRHLLPYATVLESLPGFADFKTMLDRGIGYHHAGMVPLLREYVELLFQEKLLKVVFATETLGVGINMPARTVVFTSLDKPCGRDNGGARPFRPDEFWQMAGRSGRRGMDERGFVVYHPMFPNKDVASAHEVLSLLTGRMPCARSQLRVDAEFVLQQTCTRRMLDRTLLSHNLGEHVSGLRGRLQAFPSVDAETLADVAEYSRLKQKTTLNVGFIKLTPKQRKACEAAMAAIRKKYGETELEPLLRQVEEARALEAEMIDAAGALDGAWTSSADWLASHGFVSASDGDGENNNTLTLKGRVCVAMTNGHPLIRGTVLVEGLLDDMDFERIAQWLAAFANPLRVAEKMKSKTPGGEAFDRAIELADSFGVSDQLHFTSCEVMRVWLESKDVRTVCAFVDDSQLGEFVKMVLRVIAFMDEMKPAILGLQKYDLYNRLEGHHQRLMGGVVTNHSLYIGKLTT